MTDQTAIQKVSNYMHSDIIRTRFAEVVGNHNASAYIASVMLEVANREDLQKCTMQSIYTSALRAATLRLSVDSSLGQAYLVPFKGTCVLVVGYKGLIDLATRTGRYRYINIAKIYEGEVVNEDRISGLHSLGGGKKSNKIVGWLAAFEMMNGFGKTLYMTTEDIHNHAKKYSANYKYDSSTWKKDPEAMERKTPLRLLLRKWGYLDPNDVAVLAEIEDDNVIEGEVVEQEQAKPKVKHTEKEIVSDLGFDTEPELPPEPNPPSRSETQPVDLTIEEILVRDRIIENDLIANTVVGKLGLDKVDVDTALKMARGYSGWRDMGANFDQAVKNILGGNYPK